MKAIIKMDKSGRIVIPEPLRRALQITLPAAFMAKVIDNRVELTPVGPMRNAKFKKRRGLLIVSTGGRRFSAAEAVNAMRQDCF